MIDDLLVTLTASWYSSGGGSTLKVNGVSVKLEEEIQVTVKLTAS